MKVKLHGSEGTRTLDIRESSHRSRISLNNDANERNRRACFAAARNLSKKLKRAEISQDDLWQWIKNEYNVESRKQLESHQWAAISAELNACVRDHKLCHYMIQRIKRNQ